MFRIIFSEFCIFIVMLSGIMQNVIILSVNYAERRSITGMLSVIMLNVHMLNIIILSVNYT